MDPGTIISVVDLTGKALIALAELAKDLKDAPDSLAKVISETSKLNLQLRRFESMQRALPPETQAYLDGQVSSKECRDVVKRLNALTREMKRHDKMVFSDRVKWLWNKTTVQELIVGLKSETDRLSSLITPEQIHHLLGVTDQVVGATNEINDKVERLINVVLQLQLSQPKPSTGDQSLARNAIFSSHIATTEIIWYGQWRCKPGQDCTTMPYFRDRRKLAKAAYHADWPTVTKTLQHAETAYGQNWVNTTRIQESTVPRSEPSGFTALHQAAYHGDPTACTNLLQFGAWRLLRTYRDTDNLHSSSTPLETAQSLDWHHLYPSLQPVLHRTLSHAILSKLQHGLHELIHETFGPGKAAQGEEGEDVHHLECFVLPELEVMLEFEPKTEMWFPLEPWKGKEEKGEGKGVRIALDGHELVVVCSFGGEEQEGNVEEEEKKRKRRRNFRVTRSGTREVEQAVVLA